jgi:hypothetical protein
MTTFFAFSIATSGVALASPNEGKVARKKKNKINIKNWFVDPNFKKLIFNVIPILFSMREGCDC